MAANQDSTRPRDAFATLLVIGAVAVPAIAAWHPIGATGGWKNILVFWSVAYGACELLFVICASAALADSKDRDLLVIFRTTRRKTRRRPAAFLLECVWILGLVYRGWFPIGTFLATTAVVGLVAVLHFESKADRGLAKLATEERAAKLATEEWAP